MTPTLIDQLKLAIQVESGEIPSHEIERRPIGSKDFWTPKDYKNWAFQHHEYRRKPKPLECWRNVYPDGSWIDFDTEEQAFNDHDASSKVRVVMPIRTAVHMREVTNE